ncbi:MAG TPA: hypothetical protein VF519_01000 [Mycobacteriales bacterium]|jgi:hypothetical protein
MISYVRARLGDRERGDVPGWVLITLMTAVVVAGLWGFAQESLQNILASALCTIGVNGSAAHC